MRGAVRVLLLLFVFTIPWEYSLDFGEPVGNIARVAGLLVLAAAIPAVLLERRMRAPGALQWLSLIFFLWCGCSCYWTIDLPATLMRLRTDLQAMMIVWLVWEFAETADDLRDLLRAFVGGSWVLAALTIAGLAASDAAAQIRFAAEGQDPNDVARYLDFGLPMAALLLESESGRAGKLLAFSYLPAGLLGVLLTGSRGGFVAVLVALTGCGWLLLRSHARATMAAIASAPAVAAAVWFLVPRGTWERIGTLLEQLNGGDFNQRLNIWQSGWHAFAQAPFFGTGAGTFVSAARLAAEDTAHNTALTVAVEGGVVALALALAILAESTYSVIHMRGTVRIAFVTALLVWIVTSQVATVEASRTAWLVLVLIGVAGSLAIERPGALQKLFPGAAGSVLQAAEEMA